jgi:EmrB/QacA subfamily drug resistance transporter
MLLLSPGLALFLFGVSSIPEMGTMASARVLIPMGIGLVLIVVFVPHALRAVHPLIDLHLFRNRNLSVAVITQTMFAIAFFGAGLLFPSYFLQVRGESTLAAGLLLAPQGLGAMLTMPIAGRLVDKLGPGKIVLTGIATILVSMAVFTQVGADTPYPILLAALFVMGMGMGATMMPIMTAALATLTHAEVARGSTLMNIVNQAAGSIGTATISVVLTNLLLNQELAGPAIAAQTDPAMADSLTPSEMETGLAQAADAFGHSFVVATVLIVLTLIPAALLPRKPATALIEDAHEEAPVAAGLMH